MRYPLITGVSGYFGSKVVKHLDADKEVQRIIGVDIVEPKVFSNKLDFIKMDINDFKLLGVLKDRGADSVFHLAFILNPSHNPEEMYRTNVQGTRHILDICHRLNIGNILVTSSASAYGAHADNSVPLKEDSPLRPNEDFQYARDKQIIDLMCQEYMQAHPGCLFILLRPCIVLGPNTHNYISNSIKRKFVAIVNGFDPMLQFVHEDDVARIIYLLMKKEIGGIYNVAADGALKLSEIIRVSGKRAYRLPLFLVKLISVLSWRLHLIDSPPSLLPYLMYPWLVDNTNLKSKLGEGVFNFDTRATLEDFLRKNKNAEGNKY